MRGATLFGGLGGVEVDGVEGLPLALDLEVQLVHVDHDYIITPGSITDTALPSLFPPEHN